MTTQHALKGVLDNFLGTYTSRYTEADGYWLFGKLVTEVSHLSIDLLKRAEVPSDGSASAEASRLAVRKFDEQLRKAKFERGDVLEASLNIERSAESGIGFINQYATNGYKVTFFAKAKAANGKIFESSVEHFVAPHDPQRELRSAKDP